MSCTYARGVNGAVSGIVATTSGTAAFAIKVEGWASTTEQEMADVSGFGDAGYSYFQPGKSMTRGRFNGFIYTGTASTIGIDKVQGTNCTRLVGTFTADTGRTYTGSCRVMQVSIDVNYKRGGFCPVDFQFVVDGPWTEA